MLNQIAAKQEHYLNLLSTRQKLVASNIANVDTPGYRAKDIDFQQEFLALTHGASPAIQEVEGGAAGNDGNNVNLDRQARLLAENAMRFQFVSLMTKGTFRNIKLAIQESKS